MKRHLLSFLFCLSLASLSQAQVIYNNTNPHSGGYFPFAGIPPSNSIFLDDINIPSSTVGGNDSIRFNALRFTLARLAGAPSTNLEVYYSVINDTATTSSDALTIPPTLIGTISLPPETSGGYFDFAIGDSTNPNYRLFAIPTDTGAWITNYQTLFIGLRIADTTGSGWRIATGGPNLNNFWHYNPNTQQATAYNFGAGGPPASFSIRAFGVPFEGTTLPVKLSGLAASRKENNVFLNWQTETESNNTGFWIERSTDGTNFKAISFVTSLAEGGNSSSTLSYSHTDVVNYKGILYYRLNQVDKDGKNEYSPIVAVKAEKTSRFDIVSTYPNPVVREVNVRFASLENTKLQISVMDMQGRVVSTESRQMNIGENVFTLNAAQLQAGTYIIKAVTTAGEQVTTRFVKQ